MKKSRCAVFLLFVLFILSGCASLTEMQKTLTREDTSLFQQHISTGERLEKENNITSALKEYKLAAAIKPGSEIAKRKIKAMERLLWQRAQIHYEKGVALDKRGKNEMARKEYLAALQNWPGHAGAKKRLSAGDVVEEKRFIVHTIRPGESISRLALRYYGDYKKYPLIAKFNAMKNATRVRVGQKVNIPETDGTSVAELEKRHAAYLATIKKAKAVKPERVTVPVKEKPVSPGVTPEPVESVKPLVEEGPDEPVAPVTEEVPDEEIQAAEPPVEEVKVDESPVEEPLVEEPPVEAVRPDEAPVEEPRADGIRAGEAVEEPLALAAPEDLEPPAPPQESFDDAEVYLAQGMDLFNQKEYKDAILEFDLAKKAEPGNPKVLDYLYQAHFQQGLIHHSKEEFLEAAKSFEAARENNPDCEKCLEYIDKSLDTYKEKHYTMGIYHFGKEQLKEAIAEWQLVKDIDPEYKKVSPNLKKAQMLYERLEKIKRSDN
ncbi:MAG: tetratricopeptide repeat protein [Desulfobacteraceae bacterium]|nr:tetratricopeptide repeat protein [Desulfobacteraceae bacterium]